jgi:hypothetical protein
MVNDGCISSPSSRLLLCPGGRAPLLPASEASGGEGSGVGVLSAGTAASVIPAAPPTLGLSASAANARSSSVVRWHRFAIPRRISPELCRKPSALTSRGRRECRAPDAPAAACAVVESTRVSHHGHTGNTRHSPRNGFNGFLRALPGDRLSCHRHP